MLLYLSSDMLLPALSKGGLRLAIGCFLLSFRVPPSPIGGGKEAAMMTSFASFVRNENFGKFSQFFIMT